MEDLKKGILVRNGICVGAVGDKYFSSTPIGVIQAFSGNTIPRGFLACDGASYPTTEYPDLYAVIGNTYGGDSTNFNVPDYRETVLVGVGENTTDTIASHDVYELGEFKDDQLQDHTHTIRTGSNTDGQNITQKDAYSGSVWSTYSSTIKDGRKGTTTHGKQKGVTYIIKAFHTNEGVDSNEVTNQIVEYVEGEIDALVSDEVSDSTTWSSKKTSDEIAKVETELKLINLGENADADNCRIAYGNINCVYGYCGYFTQNVPMKGYAVIRCYHYGSGIRQFIDYTASTARTYTRFIQYDGKTPTAWKELATMDKLGGLKFSASGTTLTITNGTNTWTLKANS